MADTPTVELKTGDRLVLERGRPGPPVHGQVSAQSGQFSVRLFHGNQDAGLVTQKNASGKDEAVLLTRENPTLAITGSGENTQIEIPGHVGTNKADFIPRLDIKTDSPLAVSGGAFIQSAESTQMARVATEPVDLASITSSKNLDGTYTLFGQEDALQQTADDDKRFKNSSLLLSMINGNARQNVAVEQGSPGVQFLNTRDEGKEIFLLNGKESFPENLTRFNTFQQQTLNSGQAAWDKNDKAAKEKLGTPKTGQAETAAKVSAEERNAIRAEGKAIFDELGKIANKKSGGARVGDLPEFRDLITEAQKAAQDFADTGTPTRTKADRLETALEKLSSKAEEYQKTNYSTGRSVKDAVNALKDDFPKIKSMTEEKGKKKADTAVSEAEYTPLDSLPKDVLASARSAIDPSIARGQKSEQRIDGSPDSPIVQNQPSKGGSLTV